MTNLAFLAAVISSFAFSPLVGAEVPQTPLRVVTQCSIQSVAINDNVGITVTFENAGPDDLWLFGNLKWGFRGGLTLHVSPWTADGPLPVFVDHGEFTAAELRDESSIVRLQPGTFFGLTRRFNVDDLVRTPGTYTIWIEYISPIPKPLGSRPVWSAEQGSIFSRAVTLRVTASSQKPK